MYVDIDELWCLESARGDGDAVFREPAPGSPEAGGPVVGPSGGGHGGAGAGVVQPLPLPLPPPQLQAHPPARPVVPVQLDVVGGLVVGLHVARRAAPAEFLTFDSGTIGSLYLSPACSYWPRYSPHSRPSLLSLLARTRNSGEVSTARAAAAPPSMARQQDCHTLSYTALAHTVIDRNTGTRVDNNYNISCHHCKLIDREILYLLG